ncbi:helix-turn-helix domain-containing protein [Cesiribacter andamanensis]|uniref:Putative transcriptional regulator with an HTH domain protein n=1 Tax=Cesiribacter andamanensis AMV16 TaxID=1279009 RepID=M7N8Z9_9BACT|nr:helix-turn-helix transcriptional regulator [Cesiribacter andamanensis]EMR03727.1 putative transcriptional regulator with an HTH domain protein [Cesiribacter andamanensis AMV16]
MNNNSYDLSKVNDRIQYFQDEILKVTANKFAKEVGIAYGTLRNLYSEDKKPRKSTITKILGAYDGFVNPSWLQSGKGKPTLSATQEHPAFQAMTSGEYWPKVGKQIRKQIRKSDKTPEQIAQATGYTIYRLNKTLGGKQAPTPQFMSLLLSELGITVDQLAEVAGVPVPQKEKAAKAAPAEESSAAAQEQETAAQPQAEPAEAAQSVQAVQTLPMQPQAQPAGHDGESVQELRMKIDFLTNRINYLEERMSRLAR